ncbi:VanZ family protein [Rhodoferax sp. BLA1]|uniref:VanZ family protein n=1 Tax=Rhodoferax sp. BLA1 TaxID=2576062 RepID=UPI0015D3CB28|nr:VanZ family protein [Rhodoferax sp. BLA1]
MLKEPTITTDAHPRGAPHGLNWWVFLWACVGFIVYGSLFPFNFQADPEPLTQFYSDWHMFRNLSDASDNFLLFIPLGIALDACFRTRSARLVAGLAALLLLGVGVQLLQLYLPSRTSAMSDVLWNAVGLVVGVMLFAHVRVALSGLQRVAAGQADSYAMLLVVIWFFYESFPFIPTLDIGLLREHIKSAVIAPPFETMRWLQHSLAAALAGFALWRANWLQPRGLNVLLPGALAVFLEIFVAYGNLRRETLLGIVCGLLLGYWLSARSARNVLWAVLAVAGGALLITVLTPYRGQPVGAFFTWTPFSYLFWWGNTKDISPSAFEALSIGALFWAGRLFKDAVRLSLSLWVVSVFVALVVLELGRVFLVGYHGDTTAIVLAGVLASFLVSFKVQQSNGQQTLPPDTPNAVPPPRLVAPGYRAHFITCVVLAALAGILFHLPAVPYNVRELLPPGLEGVGSVLGLTLIVYSMANGTFLLFSPRRRKWFLLFPVVIAVHGCLVWWVLWRSVPMESLADIVGSPVLGWPWQWETLGRYVALHMVIMLQLLGAILCVRAILQPPKLADALYWAVISALMAWPLYLLVVQGAATDNLTELIADDAGFWASSALLGAFFLTCLAASCVAAALAGAPRAITLSALAVVAAVAAVAMYWTGAEHTIVKYGKVFSAFQFLLSSDRTHYAQGGELVLRFGAAFLGVCCGLAVLQWTSWRHVCGIPPTGQKESSH